MDNCHIFFRNTACQYFPCHKCSDTESFNCLFCYCPLYALGENCGGSFRYTENGVKDCSACMLPHSERGYDYILSRFEDLSELAKRK